MEILKEKFCFLGDRKYIHSTTLVHFVVNKLVPQAQIIKLQIDFKKELLGAADIYVIDKLSDKEENIPADYNARLLIKTTDSSKEIFVVSNGGKTNERVPYDEEAMMADAVLREKEISFFSDEARLINKIVAANKKMLLANLSNRGFGSWKFGKLQANWQELIVSVQAGRSIDIRLKNVLDNRYTTSDILSDGKRAGTIQFARQKA